MAELSELQRKYGADGSQLTPDAAAAIMRKEMFRVKSPQETAQAILKGSSPELVPEANILQRMGKGAGIAGELANKYLPKALVLPQKYVEPSPLINAVRDVDVPTSLKMYPTVDTTTGEMIPSGFGEERVKLGKIADAIKPADLLGLTGTQKTYEALGYGQAPEPLDVLDTLGMHASLTGLGRAGFKGLTAAARAGAPYAAEGLTNLVSKYGVDPRMNVTPEAPSMSGALPAGMKLEQEGNQFVLYDASGKIFSKGPDANSVVFKANKRLENEAANAARLARREAAAEAAPVVEAKPEVKVETDPEAPLFYNPLLKAAANLEEKTDPLEILNDLKSFENVSKDQIEYSGIEDYLKAKANTNQPVTKQQIVDFVDANRVQLVEHVNKSDVYSDKELEIRDRNLQVSDPDDYHLEDQAQYYEDMAREEGEVDDIFNDLRATFDPDVYSDSEIMDMANEKIKERALESARNAYYDSPEYYGGNDVGYTIAGNNDMGWYLTDPNGRPIAENQGIYSIEEANDFIRQHALEEGYVSGSPVKFGSQTHPAFLMPGGSNYREINTAVTPVSMFKQSGRANFLRERIAAGNDRLMEIRTQYPAMIDRPPEIQKEVEELTNMRDTAEEMLKSDMQEVYDRPDFTDHFDEPDIVSQLRAQDFRDVDGKTGVLGDEIQSDLHQKGRDQGYRGSNSEIKAAGEASSQAHANFQEYASTIPQLRGFGNFRNVQTALRRANSKKLIEDNIAVSNRNLDPSEPPIPPLDADPNIDEKLNNLKELLKDYDEKNKAYSKIDSPIPDAPFKKDYYQISLRRLIKEAIDGGKDRVYIPNGEVVADRYNYARAIENIAYKMNDDGTYNIAFKPFGNNNYIQNIGNQSFSRVEESKLAGILGKDMAEKLKSGFKSETQETYSTEDIAPQQTNVINNADITVGGKGFKQYYDENYPNFLKKEAEEFGAETGYTKIPTPANHYKQRESIIRSEARKRKISTQEFEQQLNRLSRSEQEDFFTKRAEPVFYLEINDAMRKAYGKGRPYARGGYVTDAIDSADDHLNFELKNYRAGGLVKMEKGGVPEADSEAKNIEPIPLLGKIAAGLNVASDFLKSRPLKEEGTREARGATSAINSALELADSFFVNDLAKTADRLSYGFPLTSGSGETTQMLPETVGAASTVLPMAGKMVKPAVKAIRKVAPDVAETAAQMAERYAPTQMYAVPPGKKMSKAESIEAGLYHPVGGGLKLKRPISEIEFTRIPDPNMPKSPEIIITPEDLYKAEGQGYPVQWDTSAGGEILTGMKKKFKEPVVLQGGEEYQRTHGGVHSKEKTAVASMPGVITRHSNIIQRIASEGDQPISVVLAMGPSSSLEFNKMMAGTLLQQLEPKKIPDALVNAFDEQIRKEFPQFVGIKSKKLSSQLLANDKFSGNLRKFFANTMNEGAYRNSGFFPDVVESRVAISNPTMMNAQLGSGGSSFGLMDPSGKIIRAEDALNPHGTYLSASTGEHFGGFGGPRFQVQELFPSYFEQRALMGGPKTEGNISSKEWYAFGKKIPTQRYDQEWLDKIMPIYEKRMNKIKGKKKGGKVTKPKSKEDSYQLDANEPNRMGIAPYGLRYALSASEVPTAKGKGYFGEMPSPMGAVTEYSLDDRDIGDYPSVTPNQSRSNLEGIKRGEVSGEAYELARKYAEKRIAEGRSPFAQRDELRYPVPKD